MFPVPVTRRSQTDKTRDADVPMAALLMIVPFAALAVIRSAVASLRGLVLLVLVRVRFVSAQLLLVPPVVANVSLQFRRLVAGPSRSNPLATSVMGSKSNRGACAVATVSTNPLLLMNVASAVASARLNVMRESSVPPIAVKSRVSVEPSPARPISLLARDEPLIRDILGRFARFITG